MYSYIPLLQTCPDPPRVARRTVKGFNFAVLKFRVLLMGPFAVVLISRISNFATNNIFYYKTKFHFVSVANQSGLYKSIIIEYCICFYLKEIIR